MKKLYHDSQLSLRATKGSVAISLSSVLCEIASVVSLSRNDIMAQSCRGDDKNNVKLTILNVSVKDYLFLPLYFVVITQMPCQFSRG